MAYSHGGFFWSGKGRAPIWLASLEAAGLTRDKFYVPNDPKPKRVPKYVLGEFSWSGAGKVPVWIMAVEAAGLNRDEFRNPDAPADAGAGSEAA